jgi:hypothetical protein
VAIVFALVIYFSQPAAPSADQLQSEYYRGVYDVCTQEVSQVMEDYAPICNAAIERFKGQDWYAQPSRGYIP